jgi:uncharacterized protein
MQPIHIPQLLTLPNSRDEIEIQDFLPGLATLTPVQGKLQVSHEGTFLRVTVQAEAIVTLTCDRCLQQFNHRLVSKLSEMIWLEEPATEPIADEVEVPFDDLLETLSPVGYFDPQDWLYQQLCLALPQRQLCDLNCPGLIAEIPEVAEPASVRPKADRRWAALEALKQSLGE